MPVDVKRNEIDETRRQFHREVEEGVRAGTEIARVGMVADCPVGPEEDKPPGQPHMVETIEKTPEGMEGRAANGKVEGEVKVGDPSQGVDYTGYVVLGTSKMAAQDFMSPNFEQGKKVVVRKLEAVMR